MCALVTGVQTCALPISILLSGATEGEPSEQMAWTVTEQQSAAYDPEPHLEQKFRKLLHDRLTTGLGASVQEQPGPHGNRRSEDRGVGNAGESTCRSRW